MGSLMKTLFDQYNEEVEGVEEYSKCAMEYKDKYEQLQMRYNDLNQRLNPQEVMSAIGAATAGVVRYPDTFAYNAGNNPFCGCGQQMGCCNI